MITRSSFLLLAFSVALTSVESVCHCPVQGTGFFYSCGDTTCEYYRRKTCDDFESQNECEQANWELLNKRDTTVKLVEQLMKASLKKGNLSSVQVGYIRSVLALAVEDFRPEGDCSNGLSTTTRIGTTLTHCFSPELLRQCKKVANGVDSYLDGIEPRLRTYFHSTHPKHKYPLDGLGNTTSYLNMSRDLGLLVAPNDEVHDSLAEIIEVVRIYTSRAKTARVRCASYNSTIVELSASRKIPLVASLAITLATILLGFPV